MTPTIDVGLSRIAARVARDNVAAKASEVPAMHFGDEAAPKKGQAKRLVLGAHEDPSTYLIHARRLSTAVPVGAASH